MRDNLLETIDYKGFTIEVYSDDNAESPEDWGDNALFLTAYHRGFSVDGPCAIIPKHLREITHKSYCTECFQRNFTTIEETGKKCGNCGKDARVNKTYYKTDKGAPLVSKAECQALITGNYDEYGVDKDRHNELKKMYHVFGLEAYIHSGVSLSIPYEGNFPDRRWDVSQLGCVFVAKTETKSKKKAYKMAKGLIETWNQYLSGDVYGYNVEGGGGCWGFYGEDGKKEMIQEAKNEIDDVVDKTIKKHTQTLKAQIKNRVPLEKRHVLELKIA